MTNDPERQARLTAIEDKFVRFSAEHTAKAFFHKHPEATEHWSVDELVQKLLDDVTFVAKSRAELRFSVLQSDGRPF